MMCQENPQFATYTDPDTRLPGTGVGALAEADTPDDTTNSSQKVSFSKKIVFFSKPKLLENCKFSKCNSLLLLESKVLFTVL